ncbi:hypothetical protein BGX24_012276 [Mortierella sp. AD032]|nr:hypothetical protein BGX24_012276 [Mortierella sp. AD032]
MPVAMPRGDRGHQHWTQRANRDSLATPFPLYSGYLKKLGSNDRWQSRLFTFDGSGKTADGRSVTLKAKKNLELERWFFVLTKMWSFQQLLQRTEEDLAAAAATATAATEAASIAAAAASAAAVTSANANANSVAAAAAAE